MKITFDSTIGDNLRRISSPSKAVGNAETEGAFGKLLKEISPESAQIAKIIQENHSLPRPSASTELEDAGPYARYSFDPPQLVPPSMDRIMDQEGTVGQVNESPERVKKPTLLEVNRKFADDKTEFSSLANDAAKKHGVDPALGMAVAFVESSFNPNAVSRDGHYSKGLFQLLDSTGRDLHKKLGVREPYDPFNSKMNTDLGFHYLRYLHDLFSNETQLPNNFSTRAAANSSSLEKLALAAFNAGEGRVASAQHRAIRHGYNPGNYEEIAPYLPKSTREYVEKVSIRKLDFSDHFDG